MPDRTWVLLGIDWMFASPAMAHRALLSSYLRWTHARCSSSPSARKLFKETMRSDSITRLPAGRVPWRRSPHTHPLYGSLLRQITQPFDPFTAIANYGDTFYTIARANMAVDTPSEKWELKLPGRVVSLYKVRATIQIRSCHSCGCIRFTWITDVYGHSIGCLFCSHTPREHSDRGKPCRWW